MTTQLTTKTTLTANEIEALKLCLNYNERENQLSDNYSNGGMDEFRAHFSHWNDQQIGGLIGSLTHKGMGSIDEEDDIFWLTEAGVNAIFDVIENETKAA